MSNPFDDLDGLDDDSDDADGDEVDSSSESPSPGGPSSNEPETAVSETTPSSSDGKTSNAAVANSGDVDSSPDSPSSIDGPAFPYDDVKQRPLYAREEAWNAFEDALELEVERTLRDYDVRDATGRELHDAALRVAAEYPEAIANHLLELRGIEIND